MKSSAMTIVLLVVLLVVIGFVVFTTVTGRKAAKKEKAKRYKEVRNQIKLYLAETENRRNIRVEFEKVQSRKGAEYKYRDVFDVVVQLIEPKTNRCLETKAYEIEGLTTKIDKKNYQTTWVVNRALDLAKTQRRIAIMEKKIKLTKAEKKVERQEEQKRQKDHKIKEREEIKTAKLNKKKNLVGNHVVPNRQPRNLQNKFVPARKKND